MEEQPPRPVFQSYQLGELVYQLKIHLLGISPQIYRRVIVRADTTLAQLHHIFQVAMGWENYHLHSFHPQQAKDANRAIVQNAGISKP